eukprot:5592981-Alexandrium_andersonii.AAC.1
MLLAFAEGVAVTCSCLCQDDVVPAAYAMEIDSSSACSMRCCLRELFQQSPQYLSVTASRSRLTREGRWYGTKSA